MNEFEGPDQLVVYLTGAFREGDPQSQAIQSTGKFRSSVRASFLSFVARRSIPGIRVNWISPSCLTGEATLSVLTIDSVAFTAPGGVPGPVVTILNGETKIVADGEDVDRYLLISRVSAADLSGVMTLNLREEFNNVVGGMDIREGHLTAAVMFVNQTDSLLGEFTLWTPPLVRDLQDAATPLLAGWPVPAPGDFIVIEDASDWHPGTQAIQVRDASGSLIKGYVAGVLESATPLAKFWVSDVDTYGHGGLGSGAPNDRIYPVSPLRIAYENPETIVFDPEFPGAPIGEELETGLGPTSPPPTSGGLSAWSYAMEQSEGVKPRGDSGVPGLLGPREAMGLWLHKRIPTDDPILDASHTRQAWSPSLIDDLAWSFIDLSSTEYTHHARGNRRRKGRYSDTRYFAEIKKDDLPYVAQPVNAYRNHPHAPSQLPIVLPFGIAFSQAGTYLTRVSRISPFGLRTLIGEHSMTLEDDLTVGLPRPSNPVNLKLVQVGSEMLFTATYFAGADGAARADEWGVTFTHSIGINVDFVIKMGLGDVQTLAVLGGDPSWSAPATVGAGVRLRRLSDGEQSFIVGIPSFPYLAVQPMTVPEVDQFVDDRRLVL
jgi:hypothetical protein